MATRHEGDVDLEPLAPIDLDDAELGIRPEDRYAAIPPGPKLIPRRVHDEGGWEPLWLLLGLLALFLAGALLGRGTGSGEAGRTPRDAGLPPLTRVTGQRLLLLGGSGVAEYDVDTRTVRPVRSTGFTSPVSSAARTATGVVVVTNRQEAYALEAGRTVDLGSAAAVIGAEGHAWLLGRGLDGTLVAREASAGGAPTREVVIQIPGQAADVEATAYGLVANASPPREAVWLVPFAVPSEPQRLRRGFGLLGASATEIALRPRDCNEELCDLLVIDVLTGQERAHAGVLPRYHGASVLSPNGQWLFLQAESRLEALDTATGQRYALGALPPAYPQLAG